MPNRYFRVTDHLNRRTYHVADTASRMLSNLGVFMAPGERAGFKKSYRTKDGATISFKQISKALYEAGQMAAKAMIAARLPQPTIFKSSNSTPPAGRRSRSMFGVSRFAGNGRLK